MGKTKIKPHSVSPLRPSCSFISITPLKGVKLMKDKLVCFHVFYVKKHLT